jgi:chorismate dehydratase
VKSIVRLGAVGYLNARPLVYGLGQGPRPEAQGPSPAEITVRFDVPSVCAQLLVSAAIDLGLVPSITYLERPGDRVVPDVSIASDGPVASVAIFTRKPAREIRSLALDTSSRTSVVLTRVLCARRFEIAPSFVPHPPDLPTMLGACDAALLIGDPALFVDHRALGVEKIDLGQAWTDMTGLPFVWAFWSGRPEAADSDVVRRLQEARDAGVAASDSVADAYCASHAARQAIARHYLRENMKYDLSPRALEGLTAYYHEAAALGLVERTGPIEFFATPRTVSSDDRGVWPEGGSHRDQTSRP